MKKISLVIVMFLVSVIAGYCGAVQTSNVKTAFHVADTNKNGKISIDEFKHHVKNEGFKNIDRNGDNKIMKHEWQATVPAPHKTNDFESVDKNHDAIVSFLEFSEKTDKHYNYDEVFNALDRDRDGSLAPDEFNARPAFKILSIKF